MIREFQEDLRKKLCMLCLSSSVEKTTRASIIIDDGFVFALRALKSGLRADQISLAA